MGSSERKRKRIAEAWSTARAGFGLHGSARGVATTKLVGALVTLTLFVCAAYLLVANRNLRRSLRAQSSQLGCSLEYASATALMPGRFRVRGARLSNCSHGGWSALVVKAEGEVELRSLIWGSVRLQRIELELSELQTGGVALDGKVHALIEKRNGALNARIRADKLELRHDGRVLASAAQTLIDAKISVGAAALHGPVKFALDSFSSGPLEFVASGPVTGSLQFSWDTDVPRLETESVVLRTGPWRLGDQPVQATLLLHDGLYSTAAASGSARLLLQGQDAHFVLQALQAPESLSFALSGLEGAPFTFRSNVGYASGAWTFDQLQLDTAKGSISGALSIAGTNRSGTLRILYRGLPIGLQFSNGQSRVTINPPKG